MAAISALIDKDGNWVNGPIKLYNASSIDGSSTDNSYFKNQLILEFYDDVITQEHGHKIPDTTSKVTSGVTGTLTLEALASVNSPYPVALPSSGVIDLATTCILQWDGITNSLDVTADTIAGTNYINIIVHRD